MNYAAMLKEAKENGLTNEAKMWASVGALGAGLDAMKDTNPKAYWRIMRDQHAIIYEGHYSKEFAEHDVNKLRWTDNTGQHKGEKWSKEQIKEATGSMEFPHGVNDWDKYVAFNSFFSDTAGDADETTIIKMAHSFYFCDEDWHENARECTKIWDYMRLANA